MLKAVGFKSEQHTTSLGSALSLFFSSTEQVKKLDWLKYSRLPDDFRSEQLLIVLHVWLLHKRLISISKASESKSLALKVQECLFDQLWEDTCSRIRAKGINELSVNKNLKEVQGYCLRLCLELDEALKTHPHDEQLLLDDIAAALWRLLWRQEEDVDPDIVLALARYVLQELQSLQALSVPAVCGGRVAWGSPPLWPDRSLGQTAAEEPVTGEWQSALAPTGQPYYWNTRTRETRWDRPTQED